MTAHVPPRARLRRPLVGGALLLAAVVPAVAAAPMAGASPAAASGSTTTTTPSVTTAGSSKVSPKTLLAASLGAANAKGSVHYVVHSSSGKDTITVTADAASTAGSQAIVLRVGKSTGHVTGTLVDNTVYFRGDTLGLEDYLGMPSTAAPKYAGKWISFGSSTKDYATIAKSMTLASALDQISVDAPLSSGGSSTRGGRRAVSIKGTTTSLSSSGHKGSAVLYVSAVGAPLPIAFLGTGTQKAGAETGSVTYSRWGERVRPAVPATSVPSSSITAG